MLFLADYNSDKSTNLDTGDTNIHVFEWHPETAGGLALGVLLLAAVAAAAWWWCRRRRQHQMKYLARYHQGLYSHFNKACTCNAVATAPQPPFIVQMGPTSRFSRPEAVQM